MACDNHLSDVVMALLLGLLLLASLTRVESAVGVCYGMRGDNLPPPNEVIALYKSNNITRMRIYDAKRPVLDALRGSNIELLLGIGKRDVPRFAGDPSAAARWVRENILAYWPSVKFRYVVVGNEVVHSVKHSRYVLPAMRNIYDAISSAGLRDRIKVSTSVKFDVLTNTYPPSHAVFSDEAMPMMAPIVRFLAGTGTPLLANVYPYFSYKENPKGINLSYALFTSPGTVVQDGPYSYQNLFDAMVDALDYAIEKVVGPPSASDGGVSASDMGKGSRPSGVSETGWPTDDGKPPSKKGMIDASDVQTAVENIRNARTYNSNLIKHVGRGTPRRPGVEIETYIFAMFDENLKKPPGIENHWGLFYPNKTAVYKLKFT